MTQQGLFEKTEELGALLSFRAGRCRRVDKTVIPEEAKGKIVVADEDGLIHMKWIDRATNQIIDDLIIMKGECKLEKITKVTDGRVYLLQFSKREYFFWLQEPNAEKDKAFEEKFNEILNETKKEEKKEEGGIPSYEKMQELLMKGYQEKAEKEKKQKEEKNKQFDMDIFLNALKGVGVENISKEDLEKKAKAPQNFATPKKDGFNYEEALEKGLIMDLLKKDSTLCKDLIEFLPPNTLATPEAIITHLKSAQFIQSVKTSLPVTPYTQFDKVLGLLKSKLTDKPEEKKEKKN